MAGFIYIMSNPSFVKGRFKIGKSDRDPEEYRRNELDTTGVPEPFVVEYIAFVEDHHSVERFIHRALSDKRPNSQREFFDTSIEEVVELIRSFTTVVFDRPSLPITPELSRVDIQFSNENTESTPAVEEKTIAGFDEDDTASKAAVDPETDLRTFAMGIAERERAALEIRLEELGFKVREGAAPLLLSVDQIEDELNRSGRYHSQVLEEEFVVHSSSPQAEADVQHTESGDRSVGDSGPTVDRARMHESNKLALQITEQERGPLSGKLGVLWDKIVKPEMLDIKEGSEVDHIRLRLYHVGSYYSEVLKRVFSLPPEYLWSSKHISENVSSFRLEQLKREEELARLHQEELARKKSMDDFERKTACFEFARSIYLLESGKQGVQEDRALNSLADLSSNQYALSLGTGSINGLGVALQAGRNLPGDGQISEIAARLISDGSYYSPILGKSYRVNRRLLPRFRGDSLFELIIS